MSPPFYVHPLIVALAGAGTTAFSHGQKDDVAAAPHRFPYLKNCLAIARFGQIMPSMDRAGFAPAFTRAPFF
ncbi:hypothetical protein CLM73_19375 [Achromobacter spanius]|uniref:Uncharacterized protein n=1 Tax=Achromobacter spanius TaxID=217203 RepID=A0A2S0IAV2_9BURK|nr:hypothetical protein CLM73_19375 [Achromobacter spanius]